MNPYSQAGRPLSLSTPLGPDALLLEELHGSEALSGLFRFRLELLGDAARPVAFDKLLGQKVTVTLALPSGGPRYINGIVRRLTEGGQLLGARGRPTFIRYRMEVVPQFWLWTKNVRCRIFQQKSIPDILKVVLAGLEVDFRLQGQYQARNYCVQYRESDYAFACRLMEDEGIAYFFSHRPDGHTLVLTDNPQGFPFVPGPSQVHFETVAGGTRPDARVYAWHKTQELRAGKVTLWDYNQQMPEQNLGATQPTPPGVQAGAVSHSLQVGGHDKLELFDYPGGYAHHVDGISPDGSDQSGQLKRLLQENKRFAVVRMQREAAAALRVAGRSTCRQLAAGHKFALDQLRDANGQYVLTRVEHFASLAGAYRGGDAPLEYRNRFRGVPQGVPYRPPARTPKPRIPGTQRAVVVGPDGEDVFTDKYGRIKVQFFWDRTGRGELKGRNGQAVIPVQYWKTGTGGGSPTCSCWVRVAQTWAGRGWGGLFLPRIGQEVVIAFENGDPDKPVCLGCLYNEANLPPFRLPDEASFSGLKTSSVGGQSPNFSGLAFQNRLGEEFVELHAERDLTIMAEQHKVVNVGGDHHVNVAGVHMTTVGHPPPGSGGGGGDVTYTSAFNWQMGDVSAEVGKSLQLIYGEQTSAVVGLTCPWSFGSFIQVVINPAAVLGVGPAWPTAQALAAPLCGQAYFTLGSYSTMTYGTTVNMNRGAEVEMTGPPSSMTLSLATLLGATSTADVLVAGGFNPEQKVLTIAELGVASVGLLGLLVLSEVLTTVENVTKVSIDLGEDGTTADNIPAMQGAINLLNLTTGIGSGQPVNLKDTLAPIASAVKVTAQTHGFEGDVVYVRGNSGLGVASGTGPARCQMSMNGTNPAEGLKLLHQAPSQPLIQLNAAGVQIAAGIPKIGPQITLTPLANQGLTLSYGAPAPGCSISLNATGITLSNGPPGAGSSITLNAQGITLKCGATTTLQLTPTGVQVTAAEIDLMALGKYSLAALNFEETVDGTVSRAAAAQSYT
jgi:type VI secretion system secreted protein VgrG